MGGINSKTQVYTRHSSRPLVIPNKINPVSITSRILHDVFIIWLDDRFDANDDDARHTLTQLYNTVHDVLIFTDAEKCLTFMNEFHTEKVVVITSGSLGANFVPRIHSLYQVHAIYIFCANRAYHEGWAKFWHKIRDIYTEVEPLCQSLRYAVEEASEDLVPISFPQLDEESHFNRFQIFIPLFKRILTTMNCNDETSLLLRRTCQTGFSRNLEQCNSRANFDRDYCPEKAIWWFTRLNVLPQTLHRAFRLFEADLLVDMSFLIHDIHAQIERLHKEQSSSQSLPRVPFYRGQGLVKAVFERLQRSCGGFMTFSSILSASTNRPKSLQRAQEAAKNGSMFGVLFTIGEDSNMTASTVLFADIKNHRFPGSDTDVLFSMCTVFRIQNIEPYNQESRLFEVRLSLTSEEESGLHRAINHLDEKLSGQTLFERLSCFLIEVGYWNKAEQLFQHLIETKSTEFDRIPFYQQFGYIHDAKGNYTEAVLYYSKALDTLKRTVPTNDLSLISLHKKIGSIYDKMGDHLTAISYFEQALWIQQNTLPLCNRDLARTYDQLGSLYEKTQNSPSALSCYKRALEMRQENLPADRSDVAFSYHTLALLHTKMKQYSTALVHFEKALHIRQKIHHPTDSILAQSYHDLGIVYIHVQEYWKALSYLSKAVEIQEVSPEANHADTARFNYDIGETYFEMKLYETAKEFFQKALDIYQEHLPSSAFEIQNTLDRIECAKKMMS